MTASTDYRNYQAEWYQRNKERQKLYRQKNREHIAQVQEIYRLNNLEYYANYYKEYNAKYPEKLAERNRKAYEKRKKKKDDL